MGWVSSVHRGIAKAADYPLANHSDPTLAGCRSPCNNVSAAKTFAKIDGATCMPGANYGKVAGDNETQMLAWLQHGPLSVSVAAGPFNGYKGGIMTGATCNTRPRPRHQIRHGLLENQEFLGTCIRRGGLYPRPGWGALPGDARRVPVIHRQAFEQRVMNNSNSFYSLPSQLRCCGHQDSGSGSGSGSDDGASSLPPPPVP